MSSSPLSIQRLTHRFQAGTVNEKTALDHLSLEVPAGQFVTVLGSNGSGKTTLFNMILGKLIPTRAAFSWTARTLPVRRITGAR